MPPRNKKRSVLANGTLHTENQANCRHVVATCMAAVCLITQDMKFRCSLMKYAEKYGMTRASRKYGKALRYNGKVKHSHREDQKPDKPARFSRTVLKCTAIFRNPVFPFYGAIWIAYTQLLLMNLVSGFPVRTLAPFAPYS